MASIFEYLAKGTLVRKEDVASGTLAFLLNEVPSLQNELRMYLHETFRLSLPTHFDVVSQRGNREIGRPDVVIIDSEGNAIARIETKFRAELTFHQKNGDYLKDLALGGLLLFVAPASRLRQLATELAPTYEISRVSPYEKHGDHTVALVSWDEFLRPFAQRSAQTMPTRISAYLSDLRRFCDVPEPGIYQPLNSNALGAGTASNFANLLSIAFAIAKNSFDDAFDSKDTFGDAWSESATGLYGEIGGVRCWIGLNTDLWMEYQTTPFWLGITERWNKTVKVSGRITPSTLLIDDDGGHLWLPLIPKQNVAREVLLEGISDQIESLRCQLAALTKEQ